MSRKVQVLVGGSPVGVLTGINFHRVPQTEQWSAGCLQGRSTGALSISKVWMADTFELVLRGIPTTNLPPPGGSSRQRRQRRRAIRARLLLTARRPVGSVLDMKTSHHL